MKFFHLVILATTLLTACASSYKDNIVRQGNLPFMGGVKGKAKWEQPLVFQRSTWMTYVNTVYDALLAPVDKTSPYWAWLSQDNQEEISRNCKSFMFAILYSSSPLQIPHSQFISVMREVGYEDYFIPSVGSALKSHPDFDRLHMQDAKTLGFCSKVKGRKTISLDFPSFPEAIINVEVSKK